MLLNGGDNTLKQVPLKRSLALVLVLSGIAGLLISPLANRPQESGNTAEEIGKFRNDMLVDLLKLTKSSNTA